MPRALPYAGSHDSPASPEFRVTEPLRVLVADDSADFREGIAALLASVDGLELVGEAVDGDEAVAGALDLHPDVVLMVAVFRIVRSIRRRAAAPPSVYDCRSPLGEGSEGRRCWFAATTRP